LRDAGWRLSLALCLITLVTALIPAASAATGKELRIFGFGPWAFDRSLRHRLAMFEPVWRGRLRQCVTGPVTVLGLCGVPLAVSYALVAAGTAGGHHSTARGSQR